MKNTVTATSNAVSTAITAYSRRRFFLRAAAVRAGAHSATSSAAPIPVLRRRVQQPSDRLEVDVCQGIGLGHD